MPRPRTVDVNGLCESFEKFKQFVLDPENKPVSKKNHVWLDISKDLKGVLTPDAIYTIIKKNRYNIWEKLNLTMETDCQSIIRDDNDSGSEEEDVLLFEVTLTNQQKEKLTVIKKLYFCKEQRMGLRTYTTFGEGWTHVLNDIFWQQTSLPCTIVFKRVKIHLTGEYFARVQGKCKFCESVLKVLFIGDPSSEEKVQLNFLFSGNYSIPHTINYKRNLSSTVREEAVSKMLTENISPSMYRRIKANEIMTNESCEPSHLPKITTLNLAKHQHISSTWLHKNPVIALSIAKAQTKYRDTIRDIGLDRFFVHYWSTLEIEVYRSYCKRSSCSCVAIDATGSIVKKIKGLSTTESKAIFLYEIVVIDKEIRQQYSVAHMLSERHDTNSINHWLCEWLRNGATIPKIVVVDMSFALLSGVAKAFTQYNSISNYISACCSALFESEEKKYEIPTTFIRLDVAHFVKQITRWKSFKNSIGRTKEFFVRSMGQALQALTMTTLEKILKCVIVVALSETEGNDCYNNPVPCEVDKHFLKTLIATGTLSSAETISTNADVSEFLQNEDITQDNDTIFMCMNENFSCKVWLQSLVNKARTQIEGKTGDRGNQQYLPDLILDLMTIGNLIPLWSAVMVPIFGYGDLTESSCSVESNFNDVKNRIFSRHLLPMRADDFVLKHITAINGGMKLNQAAIQNLNHINDNTKEQPIPEDKNKEPEPPDCTLCESGNTPSGAHKCIICQKPVHIIGTCSFPVEGEEEGYGEKRICKNCRSSSQNLSSVTELENTENWRGLAEKSKPLKKRNWSYLIPNPDWTSIDENSKRKKVSIGILKNGTKFGLKPILIDKTFYVLQNTCAFDSLVQLFCISLNDSPNFNNLFQSSTNETICLCKNILKTGVKKTVYKKRAMILKNYFQPEQLRNQIKLLSAECSILEMTKKVLSELCSASTISTCSAASCKERIKHFTDISISVLCNSEELPLLNIKINELGSEKTYCPCSNDCTGIRCKKKNISENYFLLEIVNPQKNYQDIMISLSEIPQFLKIDNKKYELRGIIGYIGDATYNPAEIGHYLCYACRLGRWEKYDSLNDRPVGVSRNEKTRLQLLLYTKE